MNLNFNNYQFHYLLTGSKNQPAILFLHGFMGNCQDFSTIISLLSEKFYCLAVDLPGHGKTQVSGAEDCYNMSNTAQALMELLNILEIDKSFLFGYSMGGRLALYMSIYFSYRFNKVILESSSPGLQNIQQREQRWQADLDLAKQLEKSNFKDFLLNWYNQPIFQSLKNHPDFDKLIERRLSNNPIELAKSLRNLGIGNQPSLWQELENIKIPMLLLVGEYDRKFVAINNDIVKLSANIELAIVPQAGHNIHIENVNQLVTILKTFYH
ncbi:2-succinyl-6-hydroxy-2,4-cyclohexadiene-1-carboxylate synthase [Oscillatoriales cyanobacterium USR001]|nr:2-succinyl-6-hydroxy-2,4-cyclohexadiene-1-carboxylate synthase [Oscillatoriales cyanobacterium USR001]